MIKDTQPFEKNGAKKNLFLLLKKYTEDFHKLLSFVLRISLLIHPQVTGNMGGLPRHLLYQACKLLLQVASDIATIKQALLSCNILSTSLANPHFLLIRRRIISSVDYSANSEVTKSG